MRTRWRIYGFFVFLRLLIALTSFSIIHPDEHFQNPEIAAHLVFNYSRNGAGPLKTWEWIGDEPCRSIAPIWISSGVAFKLVNAFVGSCESPHTLRKSIATDATRADPSGKTLFYAERLAMLFLSLIIGIIPLLSKQSALSDVSLFRSFYLPHLKVLPLPSTLRFLADHPYFPRSPILKFARNDHSRSHPLLHYKDPRTQGEVSSADRRNSRFRCLDENHLRRIRNSCNRRRHSLAVSVHRSCAVFIVSTHLGACTTS